VELCFWSWGLLDLCTYTSLNGVFVRIGMALLRFSVSCVCGGAFASRWSRPVCLDDGTVPYRTRRTTSRFRTYKIASPPGPPDPLPPLVERRVIEYERTLSAVPRPIRIAKIYAHVFGSKTLSNIISSSSNMPFNHHQVFGHTPHGYNNSQPNSRWGTRGANRLTKACKYALSYRNKS
jgi:hypothetical protein